MDSIDTTTGWGEGAVIGYVMSSQARYEALKAIMVELKLMQQEGN